MPVLSVGEPSRPRRENSRGEWSDGSSLHWRRRDRDEPAAVYRSSPDSPLEGAGFELPVPRPERLGFHRYGGDRLSTQACHRAVASLGKPIEMLGGHSTGRRSPANPAASARAALSAMRTHRGTGSSNPFHSSAESANYRRGRHVEAVMRLGRDRVAGESRVRRFRRSVPRSAAFRPMRRLPRGPDQISLPDKQAGIAQAVAPGSSPAEHRSGNGRRYDRPGEGSPRRGISYSVSRCPGLCEAAHNLLSFAKSRRRHGCARCA